MINKTKLVRGMLVHSNQRKAVSIMAQGKSIAVIGGGAAGMTAAIFAARAQLQNNQPVRVRLLEKNPRVGKKLLATGNGRCNLTNTDLSITHYHSDSIKTAGAVFSRFGVLEIAGFFEGLGLKCHVTDGGLVYPRSMQASSVLELLRAEMSRLGVVEVCNFPVEGLAPSSDGFEIVSGRQKLTFDAVIVTCGSAAGGGSSGGFSLLRALGHRIIEPYPALTALKCDTTFIKAAAGMRAPGAATLIIDRQKVRTESGEIQFCDYGLSGIAIMQLSGAASKYLLRGKKGQVQIELDLMCELDEDDVSKMLCARKSALGHLKIEQFFLGVLNKRVGIALMKAAGIEGLSRPVSSISEKELLRLCKTLKHWRIPVTSTMELSHAQVCGGGASLDEFDSYTLQSKLYPNLYAAGEVLDIYGDCGGYNLSWAWASGAVAGTAAAAFTK